MRHRILLLESTNIFVNLALEDAIYQSASLRECNYLLMWRSAPCLVLGRHQNPWSEFSVAAAQRAGLRIARRNSGGGSVYHDLGNLNLSFMTGREQHSRKANLQFLSQALSRWQLPISVSSRDDLLLNDKHKVSGTAAKLGRLNAYHHCTLLFNANLDKVREFLKPSFDRIESSATESVPSPVANLGLTSADNLIQSIIEEYQKRNDGQEIEMFQWHPEHHTFPDGICEKTYQSSLRLLTSWEWIFGRTPNFKIFESVPAFNSVLCVTVERGYVTSCTISPPQEQSYPISEICSVLTNLPARSSILQSAVDHYLARIRLEEINTTTADEILDCIRKVCESFGS